MISGSGKPLYKHLWRKFCCDKTTAEHYARGQRKVTACNQYRGTLFDTLEPRLLFSAEHPLGLAVSASDYLDHARALHDAQIAATTHDVLEFAERKSAYSKPDAIDSESIDILGLQPRSTFTDSPSLLADSSSLMANDDVSLVIIEVTTTDDEYNAPDLSSLEGFYNDTGGAGVSLREAIAVANNDSSVDIIQLGIGEYVLDQNGVMMVSGNFHIQGINETDTVIKQTEDGNRVFSVSDPAVVVGDGEFFSIADVTITRTESAVVEENRGLILTNANSSLVLDNVTLINGKALISGGAIHAGGELYLNEVTMSDNSATQGGAIYSTIDSDIHIYDSVISNNQAADDGGAIYALGNIEIDSTLIDSNRTTDSNFLANQGGGIYLTGTSTGTITHSVFKGNHSELNGGGIWNLGNLTITDSLIFDNTADAFAGGIGNGAEGIANIVRVSIVDNESGDEDTDSDSGGGALYNHMDGTVNVISSIITGNKSEKGSAGAFLSGKVTIADSIIVNNVSEDAASENISGGIAFHDEGDDSLTITNSVIANNYVDVESGQGVETGVANDLEWFSVTNSNEDVSGGNNLIETSTNVTTESSDFTGVDPEIIDISLSNTDPVDFGITITVEDTSLLLNNGSTHTAGQLSVNGSRLDSTPDIGGYAFDSITGMVFWSDSGGSIYRTGSTFAKSFEIVSGAGLILDLQVDTVNERIYWLDSANYELKSALFDGSDTQIEHSVNLDAIAFTLDIDNDRFYVITQGTTSELIQYVTSDIHASEAEEREGDVIPIGSFEPVDIVLNSNNDVLYALDVLTAGAHSLISVETLSIGDYANPTRDVQVLVSGTGDVNSPNSLAINSDSNTLYWTEPDNSDISSYIVGGSGTVDTYLGFWASDTPLEIVYDSINDNLLIAGNNQDIYSLSSDFTGSHNNLAANEEVIKLAFSSVESSSQVAVNIAPVRDNNTGVALTESSQVLIESDALNFTDDKSNGNNITFTRTDSVDEIILYRLDEIVTEFTQNDIQYNYIRFVHNGDHVGSEENWTVSLEFNVSDKENETTKATVDVSVAGVNDAPLLLTQDSLDVVHSGNSVLFENVLSATDEEDDDATLMFEVTDTTYGVFTLNDSETLLFSNQDIVDGKVSFSPDSSLPAGNYSIDGIRVVDSDNTISEGSINLRVLPADPAYSLSSSFNTIEGGSVNLDNTYFNVTDPDTDADNVTFTIIDAAEGEIRLDDIKVDSFSLKELVELNNSNESRVIYQHSGAEPSVDAFIQFELSDEQSVEILAPIYFEVASVNDTPELTIATSHIVNERDENVNLSAISVFDPDAGDTFEITVTDGRFTVFENNLGLADNVSLDYEGTNLITFDVIVTDDSGEANDTVSETITVTVTDGNDTPVLNLADEYVIQENAEDVILDKDFASDEDVGQTLTYDVSDARFEVIDNQLQLKPGAFLNHETDDQMELDVIVFDNSGDDNDTVSKTVILTVTNVNDVPVLNLEDEYIIEENQKRVTLDTEIALDDDVGDSLTYHVSDDRFEVSEGSLKLKTDASFDYENSTPISIDVSVQDSAGGEASVTVTVIVSDANDAPVIVPALSYAVEENMTGAIAGSIIITDQDVDDQLNIIVNDQRFEVVDEQLKLAEGIALNFEEEPAVDIVVAAQDSNGETTIANATIVVNDTNDNPEVDQQLVEQVLDAESIINVQSGIFVDQDGDALTYNLTLANGNPLPEWINFEPSTGLIALGAEPDSEVTEVLRLIASDDEGASVELEFEVRFIPEPVTAAASPSVNESFEISDVEIFSYVDSVNSAMAEVVIEPEAEENTAIVASTTSSLENGTSVDGTEDSGILKNLFNYSSVDISGDSQEESDNRNILRHNAISEFIARQVSNDESGFESGAIINIFDDSVNIENLFTAMVEDAPELYSNLSKTFENQREAVQEQLYAARGIIGSSAGLTSGLSVGYILYLIRGGALLSSVLSSLPAWRFVDPLPILGSIDSSMDSDEESLQSIVDTKRAA